MNQTVTIRSADENDAELLARLGRQTFHDAFAANPFMPPDDLKIYLDSAFTVSQMSFELRDPKSLFFLAEIAGEAAGYAKLERGATVKEVTGKNPIKLKRLYAKQNFIGFSVGKTLMKLCLDEAAKLKHDTIWLTVWEHNRRARNFYKRWNFEACGTIDFLLGNAPLTDFIMRRTSSENDAG